MVITYVVNIVEEEKGGEGGGGEVGEGGEGELKAAGN